MYIFISAHLKMNVSALHIDSMANDSSSSLLKFYEKIFWDLSGEFVHSYDIGKIQWHMRFWYSKI